MSVDDRRAGTHFRERPSRSAPVRRVRPPIGPPDGDGSHSHSPSWSRGVRRHLGADPHAATRVVAWGRDPLEARRRRQSEPRGDDHRSTPAPSQTTVKAQRERDVQSRCRADDLGYEQDPTRWNSRRCGAPPAASGFDRRGPLALRETRPRSRPPSNPRRPIHLRHGCEGCVRQRVRASKLR